MKKFLSMTMTLIMLMALAFPAFAVDKESDSNSEAEVQEEILESASEFAYLDADKATPELKEKILEARLIWAAGRENSLPAAYFYRDYSNYGEGYE